VSYENYCKYVIGVKYLKMPDNLLVEQSLPSGRKKMISMIVVWKYWKTWKKY